MSIELKDHGEYASIVLNRPDQRNALTFEMIVELRQIFSQKTSWRFLTLEGRGKHFCAGADLNWMKASAQLSEEENLKESQSLFDMYASMHTCPIPILGKFQGAAMGGAVGLVSCCDIALAEDHAFFCLSEVRLGLAPATIAPFVEQKIGPSYFKALSLTAERVDSSKAQNIALVHRVLPESQLDEAFDELKKELLNMSPQALKKVKELSHQLSPLDLKHLRTLTSSTIAKLRASPEGQEGLTAFFEKRLPKWR